jgi:hypothetical protein
MKTTWLLFLMISWSAWKGGASAPPSQAFADYFDVPRPAQLATAGCWRNRRGSPDYGGAEAPPFRLGSAANSAIGHPRDAEHAAPDDGRPQAERKASDERQGDGRVSGRNHPPGRASLTKANRAKHVPNSRLRSLPGGRVMNLQQARAAKSGDPAKGGLIQAVTVNGAPRRRPVSLARSAVPSLNNVRHRGPNPAMIGGLAPSHSANTGTINGTRMNRKP